MRYSFLKLKGLAKQSSFLAPVVYAYSRYIAKYRRRPRSDEYWEKRYREGFNSGRGSYGELAHFKAEIINSFVKKNRIQSVVEFGCGDGNQLTLAEYERYIGIDVSAAAVQLCEDLFSHDESKQFCLLDDYKGEKADLALSLDVIYHLIEDSVFADYMARLFDSSKQHVIIYSSNMEHDPKKKVTYVRHRKFTQWIIDNLVGWELIEHIQNPHVFDPDNETGSFADFYIYTRTTL